MMVLGAYLLVYSMRKFGRSGRMTPFCDGIHGYEVYDTRRTAGWP